ncbi:isoflavone reductase family protein [Diplodia corticola]|uniref:Isoflavone reductase family protein n=1 Tax=Diplodia corticola TaxID=236234 RepID=A0A1J9QSE6_9PEZI|nr:isoflavone reductase family protein [Diplodia corticola]OJD31376.1 isoflavone reductase family protein [Diplodia corticola]
MAPPTEKVLVFGATGVIGRYITNALVNAQPPFKRIGIYTSADTVERKAAEIQALKNKGVDVFVGSFNDEDKILEVYKGFDTVVSAVGRNVIAEQIGLIKLAEQSPSIARFFPSEYGTDIKYGPQSATEKPHQLKLKVRAYLESDAVNRLEYTYLVTGPYADLYIQKSAHAPEAGTFDVRAKKATLLGDGDGRISLTTMDDVGKLVTAALQHPEHTANRALIVNSFTTTPKEILAEFERQTGGDKWAVEYTPLPALEQAEARAWDQGVPYAAVFTLRRIWTQGGTLYEGRDNDLVKAPESETLGEAVAKAVEAQG